MVWGFWWGLGCVGGGDGTGVFVSAFSRMNFFNTLGTSAIIFSSSGSGQKINFYGVTSPGPPPPTPEITGGETTVVNGYNVHSFKTTGPNAMTVTGGPITVQVLLVAGGGGPGGFTNNAQGGGGGGGVYYTSSYTLSSGTYTVNVGSGGNIFANGQNSNIYTGSTLILYDVPGGGAGGSYSNPTTGGLSGGSGGGAGNGGGGGAGIPPFGHDGGAAPGYDAAGGGGGAGNKGGDALGYYGLGGNGGDGLPFTITGDIVFYGAGGPGKGFYERGKAGIGGDAPNSGGGGSAIEYLGPINEHHAASGIVIISESPISSSPTNVFYYTGAIETYTLSPGTYTFTVAGAAGASAAYVNGGNGMVLVCTYTVVSQITIQYIVGQAGGAYGGGGGGSFIYDVTNSRWLFVAGGGGGGCDPHYTVSGQNARDASVPGNGSGGTSDSTYGLGGGGGGVNANGSNAGITVNGRTPTGGLSWGNGGGGGTYQGGFGGGGGGQIVPPGNGGHVGQTGGGGGGYTGGSSIAGGAQGGTSYCISGATIVSQNATNAQNGYIFIQ